MRWRASSSALRVRFANTRRRKGDIQQLLPQPGVAGLVPLQHLFLPGKNHVEGCFTPPLGSAAIVRESPTERSECCYLKSVPLFASPLSPCQGVPQALGAASVSNLSAPGKGCTFDFFCERKQLRLKLCFQSGTPL